MAVITIMSRTALNLSSHFQETLRESWKWFRMAPYKKPNTLLKLCLQCVAVRIDKACSTIAVRYGNYDVQDCRSEVAYLHDFLLSQLPGFLLDKLCQERLNITVTYDPRIIIAIYMHKNMKKFMVSHERYLKEFPEEFWRMQLCGVKNIVYLDLYMICTDEILQVVGQHCLLLEHINIMSKVISKADAFNALRVESYISDFGLKCLENCKNLRVIEMNQQIRSRTISAGRKFSVAGVRRLVKNLPCLREITFHDMGRVISDDMDDVESLMLTHITDSHPAEIHILSLSRLCKNLTSLSLQNPPDLLDKGNAIAILNALTESSLHITRLELQYFEADDALFNYIHTKGHLLTHLSLIKFPVTVTFINFIGNHCANIVEFILRETSSDSIERISNVCEFNRIMFTKLKYLALTGLKWNPNVILPLILSHAKLLTKLYFSIANRIISFDQTLQAILKTNSLTELRVFIADGGIFSMDAIRYFVALPHITEFRFFNHHPCLRTSDFRELQNEIKQKNLDINFVISEIFNEAP